MVVWGFCLYLLMQSFHESLFVELCKKVLKKMVWFENFDVCDAKFKIKLLILSFKYNLFGTSKICRIGFKSNEIYRWVRAGFYYVEDLSLKPLKLLLQIKIQKFSIKINFIDEKNWQKF